jgi:uncharacterized protein YpmS
MITIAISIGIVIVALAVAFLIYLIAIAHFVRNTEEQEYFKKDRNTINQSMWRINTTRWHKNKEHENDWLN